MERISAQELAEAMDPVLYLQTVRPGDDTGESCRVAASGDRDGVVVVLAPSGAAQPPPGDGAPGERGCQRCCQC